MKNILTIEEIRNALSLDYDYDPEELETLSQTASVFLFETVGYDFSQDNPIHPLAKQAAKMYAATTYYSGINYKKEYDYSYGLTSTIKRLELIAKKRLAIESGIEECS